MSMESALAVLGKSNEGTGQPIPSNLTASTISAEADKEAAGGKTLAKVMGEASAEPKPIEPAKDPNAKVIEEKIEVAPPKAEEAPPKISPQIEALMRRERRIQADAQRVRQEKEAIAKERAELDPVRKMREEMKRNPLKALEYGGITYKQLTDSVLAGGTATPELQVAALGERLEQIEQTRQQEKEAQAQEQRAAATRELQRVEAEYREDIKEFGLQNADTYELTNLNNGHNLVYNLIDNHYRQTGKIMSIKQGYDILEKAMEDQVEKNLQSKKWKARAGAKPTDSPTRSASDTRTLTNNMTSSAPSFLPAKSEEERMRRALEKLG